MAAVGGGHGGGDDRADGSRSGNRRQDLPRLDHGAALMSCFVSLQFLTFESAEDTHAYVFGYMIVSCTQ